MSPLKKRVALTMVVSLVLIAAGIVVWRWRNSRYDQAFTKEVTSFDIRHTSTSDESEADAFAERLAVNGLIIVLGGSCFAGGVIGLLISAAVWIKKPVPGSTLTLRGWKAPGELSERDIATDKASQAVFYGFLASSPWITSLGFGFRSFLLPSHLATKILVLLLIECCVFYILDIRLCLRRDRSAVIAAKGPWNLALVLNHGGLCAFLLFMSSLFILRARS